MKKTLLIILFIIGVCFGQTYDHLSIDRLTITLTDLEIGGDVKSPSKFNWKANLVVNGLEMQYKDQEFQKFVHQITDDNKIIIDQFRATVSVKDRELKITNARFSSPFLKADIKAEMIIDMNNIEDSWLKSSTLKLDVLSTALEKFVFELEKELKQALPRKGKSIVIEAKGSLKNPRVKDMDMEKLTSPYNESVYASEAKSVISSISNASVMFYQSNGEWPSSVDDLEREGQLDLKLSTKLKWQFELQLPEMVIAISTEEMAGGAGKVILYNRELGKYTGYGTQGK
jgi:hypothetical protein